jgi:hypothetical protein
LVVVLHRYATFLIYNLYVWVEVLHLASVQLFSIRLNALLMNYADLSFLEAPELFHHDWLIKVASLVQLQLVGAVSTVWLLRPTNCSSQQ